MGNSFNKLIDHLDTQSTFFTKIKKYYSEPLSNYYPFNKLTIELLENRHETFSGTTRNLLTIAQSLLNKWMDNDDTSEFDLINPTQLYQDSGI